MIKQALQEELKKAMLARDEIRTSTLRLLLSAINYYEIQKGGAGYQATEEDITQVIQKEVKQRKDSIEQFGAGGRQDLVDKETKELKILQAFLPEQMGEEEIRTLIKQAITETGSASMADIGKVMGNLMPRVRGQADGSLVNKIAREELST